MTTATFPTATTKTINVTVQLSPAQVKTALFATIIILVNAFALL